MVLMMYNMNRQLALLGAWKKSPLGRQSLGSIAGQSEIVSINSWPRVLPCSAVDEMRVKAEFMYTWLALHSQIERIIPCVHRKLCTTILASGK